MLTTMTPESEIRTTRVRPGEEGVTLIVALIFLAVLTILGLGVVATTTNDEKMARNFRDMDIAFAATEAALRDAEIRITYSAAKPFNYSFNSTCNNGLCGPGLANPVDTYDFFGSSAPGSNSIALNANTATSPMLQQPTDLTLRSPAVQGVTVQPRYLVESLCRSVPGESATSSTCQTVYRITAKGKGISNNTAVVLQEVFIP